jgi:hypothetical protein
LLVVALRRKQVDREHSPERKGPDVTEVLHFEMWCYTTKVPTTRPRHVVTETEEVAQALDDAARRWPEDRANRAKLLLRLVEEGHRAVTDTHEATVRASREAVSRTSGALTGLYGDGYLDLLRKDWPL